MTTKSAKQKPVPQNTLECLPRRGSVVSANPRPLVGQIRPPARFYLPKLIIDVNSAENKTQYALSGHALQTIHSIRRGSLRLIQDGFGATPPLLCLKDQMIWCPRNLRLAQSLADLIANAQKSFSLSA